uniref:Vesicular, overexpressed in cancer, prosurvival protein 1 n=1 Tax=Homalodisca liturata TaxID=320908 RepID=A0A1B6JRF9_9HEMI
MAIANYVLSSTLMLIVLATSEVHGFIKCESFRTFSTDYTLCSEGQYCCGANNLNCCSYASTNNNNPMEAVFGILLLLIIFVCCPWMCYRCCCRRTTSRGFVYSQAGTTTSVSVSLPPGSQQQVPYPTVVPYPQQTPYPPQYATNPYFGVPPPAYGPPVQAGVQQASAPTAPPYAQS